MESHLLQMRGLKLCYSTINRYVTKSHLLQMRGLKHPMTFSRPRADAVASFTDAWIETFMKPVWKIIIASHLLQMRGLKHRP